MISVIVPIYNTEIYLEECLDSLINQTIPFYEIILVNDGASDICKNICQKYSVENENIVIVNQVNQGLSVSRNNGIKVATGEYVLFVDSDDLVEKDMNEKLLHRLTVNEVDVLYYSAEIKNEQEKQIRRNQYVRETKMCNCIMTGKEFFEKTYPENYIVSACCAVYKRLFLESNKIVFPKGIFYEDNPFYINVVLRAKRVECIPDKLYIRRYRPNSITTSEMSVKKCKDMLTAQMLIWSIIKSNNIDCKQDSVYKDYILRQGVQAIDNVILYEELKQKQTSFLMTFMDYWRNLFDLNSLDWNELCTLMKFGQLLDSSACEKQNVCFFEEVKKLLVIHLVEKLRNLPFQNEALIAIYGIGKNTNAVIGLYELFIGKIKSEICYIVSDRNEMMQTNKMVYTCDELPNNVEKIVISSRVYQQEMLEKLKKSGISTEKINLIYYENDRFDLAFVAEMFI